MRPSYLSSVNYLLRSCDSPARKCITLMKYLTVTRNSTLRGSGCHHLNPLINLSTTQRGASRPVCSPACDWQETQETHSIASEHSCWKIELVRNPDFKHHFYIKVREEMAESKQKNTKIGASPQDGQQVHALEMGSGGGSCSRRRPKQTQGLTMQCNMRTFFGIWFKWTSCWKETTKETWWGMGYQIIQGTRPTVLGVSLPL